MRKIFSILVAVGLVLGMIAMAAPVSAQMPPYGTDWTEVDVAVYDSDCEGRIGTYNITFPITASLTEGVHSICVQFPEGTGYPATWRNGHIRISNDAGATWTDVFGSEVTRAGDEVCFLVPIHYSALDTLLVQFRARYDPGLGKNTGIVNPPAGKYNLYVKTDRAPMSTYVMSGWVGSSNSKYTIKPLVTSYKFVLDFSPTYPGIAEDFIVPFKACGQNDTDEAFDTWYDDGIGWVTNFTLWLGPDVEGCAGCDDMSAYITLISAPSGGVAHWYDGGALAVNFSMAVLGTKVYPLFEDVDLASDYEESWDMGLHFNKEGTYEFCFDLVWGGDPEECCVGCESVQRCEEFVVHQWKDAAVIELDYKWNLFSLPIVPFDTSIESVLAPLPKLFGVYDAYSSIWYYDRCLDEWFAYGNGQTSLTTLEDGKAYWIRMWKPGETLYTYFSMFYGWPLKLWVFGHKAPMPPNSPSAYPVCPGWNMVGFRSTVDMPEDDYLWSVAGIYDPGAIFGWNAGATQNWFTVGTAGDLEVGLGYWIPFIDYGEIYPPLP